MLVFPVTAISFCILHDRKISLATDWTQRQNLGAWARARLQILLSQLTTAIHAARDLHVEDFVHGGEIHHPIPSLLDVYSCTWRIAFSDTRYISDSVHGSRSRRSGRRRTCECVFMNRKVPLCNTVTVDWTQFKQICLYCYMSCKNYICKENYTWDEAHWVILHTCRITGLDVCT